MYLNKNNLNGWAMTQYLSFSGYRWLNQKKIDKLLLNSVNENSSDGYILEVGLEYPDGLHELHNDYSLAASLKLVIIWCQNISFNIANKHGIKIRGVNKLVQIKVNMSFTT